MPIIIISIMKKIITAIIISCSITLVNAQNMSPERDVFYDIKDTSISVQGFYETVSLLDVINQEIKDSLDNLVAKAIPRFNDTTLYSFILSLCYEYMDTTYIHVHAHALSNLSIGWYYKRTSVSGCKKNKEYTVGFVRIGMYYVLIRASQSLSKSELENLFREREEKLKLCLHVLPEEIRPLWDDPRVVRLPHMHFTLRMHNPNEYISPRCDF